VLVGHSLGGLTVPLVAASRPVRRLVFLCGLIPELGRSLVDQVTAVLGGTRRARSVLAPAGRRDLLLTPTVACPPFALGLDFPGEVAGKPIAPSGWIPYTYPFNLTGQPAASVPCGFTRDGLPIGLQIVGRRFDDATVLRAAAAFERERPWANARPGL
jgi:Asp-tRNA(Asn)/Glu-tRNA(Gln) amidotransferase A subunit family amidase